MSVSLHPENDGKLLTVHVSDRLTREDYQKFMPEIEKYIKLNKKIRILFVMDDFHGWKVSALWEDMKMAFKHWSDIERIAMVGDKAWEEGMAFFCKPFTAAKVRYFDHHEIDRAREWVGESLVAANAGAHD